MRKVDQIYAKQKELQKELEELRENCPHTQTYESLYSWRVGSYNPARLCTVCDEFIEYIEDSRIEQSSTDIAYDILHPKEFCINCNKPVKMDGTGKLELLCECNL